MLLIHFPYFPADILYHRTLSYLCKKCSNLIQPNQKKIKYYHTPALHLTHHTPSQHSIFFSFSSHSSILSPTGNCPFTLLFRFLALRLFSVGDFVFPFFHTFPNRTQGRSYGLLFDLNSSNLIFPSG